MTRLMKLIVLVVVGGALASTMAIPAMAQLGSLRQASSHAQLLTTLAETQKEYNKAVRSLGTLTERMGWVESQRDTAQTAWETSKDDATVPQQTKDSLKASYDQAQARVDAVQEQLDTRIRRQREARAAYNAAANAIDLHVGGLNIDLSDASGVLSDVQEGCILYSDRSTPTGFDVDKSNATCKPKWFVFGGDCRNDFGDSLDIFSGKVTIIGTSADDFEIWTTLDSGSVEFFYSADSGRTAAFWIDEYEETDYDYYSRNFQAVSGLVVKGTSTEVTGSLTRQYANHGPYPFTYDRGTETVTLGEQDSTVDWLWTEAEVEAAVEYLLDIMDGHFYGLSVSAPPVCTADAE